MADKLVPRAIVSAPGEDAELDEEEEQELLVQELVAEAEETHALLALSFTQRMRVALSSRVLSGGAAKVILVLVLLLAGLTVIFVNFAEDTVIYEASLATWCIFLASAVLLFPISRFLGWIMVGLLLFIHERQAPRTHSRLKLYLYNLQPAMSYQIWSICTFVAWRVVFVRNPYPPSSKSSLSNDADWIQNLLGTNIGVAVFKVAKSLILTSINLKRLVVQPTNQPSPL